MDAAVDGLGQWVKEVLILVEITKLINIPNIILST